MCVLQFSFGVLLLLSVTGLANSAATCADVLFIINTGINGTFSNGLKESVANVAKHLELDSGLHKAAFVKSPYNVHVKFDEYTSTDSFLNAVYEQETSNESSSKSKDGLASPNVRLPFGNTLDEELTEIVSKAIRHHTVPLVVILFDNGSKAFTISSQTLGKFAKFLHSNNNVYFYIASRKAKRLQNSLLLSENEANLLQNSKEEIDALLPFLTCTRTEDFRRRPQTGTLILGSTNNVQLEQRVIANNKSTLSERQRQQQKKLSTKQVSTTSTTTTTTRRPYIGRPGCQFDIVLLMDFSGGASNKRQRYLDLASDLIKVLDIGEFGAQVAMVRYSGPGRSEALFRFKKHQNSSELIKEIQDASPLGGTTRTGEALLFAAHQFDEKFGSRSKAEKILILFTDGYSQDDPSDAAKQLKRKNIHIYTVAVQDVDVPPNLNQLQVIASDAKSLLLDAQFEVLKRRFTSRRCN